MGLFDRLRRGGTTGASVLGDAAKQAKQKAGRAIGEVCGRLIRPVTLELGGKSASVILDDADLPTLLGQFFEATLMNNGQTCYLGTRVLAPSHRYTEIVDTLTDFARSLVVGDALDSSTQIGPLASARGRRASPNRR